MGKTLEWKKKKQEGECSDAIVGLIFGALFGLVILGFGGKLLYSQLGIYWLPQFYYFVQTSFSNLFQIHNIPEFFYYVFYTLIGGLFGTIFGAGARG